ncbi:hypothetical protein AVEN_93483-1 [Araneus ventricosus]|uniref:Uncharacterized protein n=1 Tax=Araneus ventricosus TaxID=182803 RepID=A0A4Y2AR91_ARAVE|nr:hypothetical protein AVEN_93483-1 [Araneus ventricosus]
MKGNLVFQRFKNQPRKAMYKCSPQISCSSRFHLSPISQLSANCLKRKYPSKTFNEQFPECTVVLKDNTPVMGCLRREQKKMMQKCSFLIRFSCCLHLSPISQLSANCLKRKYPSKTFNEQFLECTVVLKDNTPVMGCLRREQKKMMQKCSFSNSSFSCCSPHLSLRSRSSDNCLKRKYSSKTSDEQFL